MKNLKNIEVIELNDSEAKEVNGGFGLVPILFLIGFGLAYYEVRVKPTKAEEVNL